MEVLFEVSVFSKHVAAVSSGGEHAQVCVLGNAPELGAWDTSRAVALSLVEETAAEKRFAGAAHFPLDREFFALEYKYMIKDTKLNEVVAWESIPGNRTLTLTTAANIARNKPATQSSTYHGDRMPYPGDRSACLGNNGDRNGFQEWRCSRTTREANPWWTVDLVTQQELIHLNLWKGRTYHEAPKRAVAKPAVSTVRDATHSSALPSPPVWIFISADDLRDKSGADLIKLAKAPGYLPPSITALPIELHEDRRVESIPLKGITGRYVCIQHESTTSSLQFAEVEVFVAAARRDGGLQQRDGVFGVDAAVNSDLYEYVDSEWVDPASGVAMLRLWIGSFRNDVPAVQWFTEENIVGPVHVELRHETHTQGNTSEETIPVDARGASLLGKDGGEFRAAVAAASNQTQRDLKRFLNSSGASSVAAWLERFTRTQLLSDEQATRIQGLLQSRTFQDGKSLLRFGERTRTAFFIEEGEVQVSGPTSATGSVAIGSLSAGSAINDLALFSHWPSRCATFTANGSVTAKMVTQEVLVQVLGEEKLGGLRNHLLREHQALSPAGSNQALLVVDSNHAQVFRTKIPIAALSSSGTAQHPVHKLFLDVYEATGVGSTVITSVTDKGKLLGSAPLLPAQISAHGEGYLTLPIVSPSASILGQVSAHYLVIKPFIHARNTLSSTWRSYWREREPLAGGHRGMGRHFNQVGGFRKALVRENTLASFILAGKTGADFVEFDVQLTKDHVPILYHDFILRAGLEDTRAWSQGVEAEQHEVAIHRLTYRELIRAHTSPVPRKEMPKLKRLVKKHWVSILGRTRHTGENVLHRNDHSPTAAVVDNDDHLVDLYPRLEDLLKHVPPHIALNIEIKYPDDIKRSASRFSPAFALDYYIDRILHCVFDHAGAGRRIFFSCFDPVVVVALRAKQATYPVFFLTYGRIEAPVVDARLTLQFAINFVKMERLTGIVSNSDHLLLLPAAVELVKQDGVVLMTWGDQNTSYACVQRQKQHGIDGVISDNVIDLTREDIKARKYTAKPECAIDL